MTIERRCNCQAKDKLSNLSLLSCLVKHGTFDKGGKDFFASVVVYCRFFSLPVLQRFRFTCFSQGSTYVPAVKSLKRTL